MPSIYQLVRKARTKVVKKSRSVAMGRGFNTIQNKPNFYASPFKRGVCTKVTTTTTEILVPEVVPVEDAPAFDADIDDPYERVKDDLPELS